MTTPGFALRANGQPISDWVTDDGVNYRSATTKLTTRLTTRELGAAAREYRLALTNVADTLSPVLSHIEFCRLTHAITTESVPVVHHCGGGLTDAVFPSAAWRVKRTELPDWAALKLEGARGRSSNKDLPLFLVTDERDEAGLAFAVGYSGNVVSTILREFDYRSVVVSAGIRDLQLRIPPGETVPVSSMLVVPYRGDHLTGLNALRRVLREQVCPPATPRITYDHWFGLESRYDETILLREAEVQAQLGTEVFVVDAAWAQQGNVPHYGAGNWETVDDQKFPHGLKAFADKVRGLGMKFGLWIEPETVEAGTQMDRQFPDALIRLPGAHRYLADFSRPEIGEHLFAVTGRLVDEFGVEWFRVDSNLDPDPYWATIADPGERGYRELRHFEGFYRYLDRLRERYPHLHLEGCSSGGRRIDLELLKRHHSFWVSDNTVFPATVHQHLGGANHFLPAHLIHCEVVKYPRYPTRDGSEFTDYWLASLCGGLFGIGAPLSQYPVATRERLAGWVAQYRQLRRYLAGDFYPLLPQPSTTTDWDAWQFHLPATDEGMLLVFRPRGGPAEMEVRPRGFSTSIRVALPEPHTAKIIRYAHGKEL